MRGDEEGCLSVWTRTEPVDYINTTTYCFYWQRQIQLGASFLVIGFGIFRLVNRRHRRALARIRPTQLGLWSFAVAIAHGAGLMLVPIYLGLCKVADL